MDKNWISNWAVKALRKLKNPWPIKEAAWQVIKFLVACGKSHPLSFALRPIADNKYVRLVPGMILFLGILWWTTPLTLASGVGGQIGINLNLVPETILETKISTQLPVNNFVLTQGFSIIHSGYDMAVPIGTRVRPVMSGVVKEAERNWHGYGNMILVDHKNGYESRYGHLSQIWVQAGQEVDLGTTLGLSGSTGRSTGPHLHLEIIENGRVVSPKTVLGI